MFSCGVGFQQSDRATHFGQAALDFEIAVQFVVGMLR